MSRSGHEKSQANPLDSLRHAREVAAQAISGAENPEAAFKIATDLADAFRHAADWLADMRACEVARFRDSEDLSLSEVAVRLNISKSRADQLVRAAARAQRTDPGA